MMKKTAMALLVLGSLAAGSAAAETSVTLYGIADISMRYLSRGSQDDGSRFGLANGAISNSRWGLRGTEDLGDGMKAFFRLENGINLQNGTGSDPDKSFSRLAYLGLDGGAIGSLTLGLQNTPMFNLLADHFDPLTVGNYDQNAWLPAAMSRVRTSNMVTYANTLGDLALVLSYANGEDYDDHKVGSQYGASLRYTFGQFAVGGAYQHTYSDSNSEDRQRVWNLNASYQFESAKVFLGYFNGRDETGFVNAVMGGTPVPGLDRKDDGYFAGVTWNATPRWALTGAAYYDRSKNVIESGDKGKRYALVGVAEYALSKRSQVYATVDYNKVKDAARDEIAGSGSQVGAAVGFRHIF